MMLCSSTFQVGDVVRVREARRRDVTFSVTELGPNLVVAVNDRGGECRYAPEAFELVQLRTPPSEDPRERAGLGLPRMPTPVVVPREAIADTGCVRPFAGEDIDSLLRRFRKASQRAGIPYGLRRHQHFLSRSQRRRQKADRARRRREAA